MAEMRDEDFTRFVAEVYRLTRIHMDGSKRALLINRLEKRLRDLNLATFDDYYKYLKKDPSEEPRFINAVTTNETYFFRAPKVWEFFGKTYLSKWFEANRGKTLSVWCAAASSGEEPYTIAMLCEEFARTHPGFLWTLKASDIAEDMIQKCREARYFGRAIEKVDPQLLRRYFDVREGGEYAIKPEFKKKLSFFKHRLQDEVKFGPFDIIFVRNVLIYFDVPTKELVLAHAERGLKPGGTLVVGESEGLLNVKFGLKYLMPSVYVKEAVRGVG